MTPEQFCYWLQGFAEMSCNVQPDPSQWRIIKDHLQTVFEKKTPAYPGPATSTPAQPWGPTTITQPQPWGPNPLAPYTTPPGGIGPTIIC